MSKVIAVMDKPENCQSCVFGVCKYSLPLSSNRKGYYCQLLPPEHRVVQDFDYDADVHLDNCPLREMPEKYPDKDYTVEEDHHYMCGYEDGYNACIDAITGE